MKKTKNTKNFRERDTEIRNEKFTRSGTNEKKTN